VSAAPFVTVADGDLVDGLFPAGVLVATAAVDPADEEALLEAERPLVASAVPKRRQEFASARRCARSLLARLGEPSQPILRTPGRAPIWPAGVVGSISHCDGRVAVAVARRGAIAGVGIDVEPDAALEPALWRRICRPAELAALPARERGRLVRVLFSAKEALYKCVHPYAQRVIGFHEVAIVLRPTERFEAALPDDVRCALPPEALFSGRFVRRDGWILTGATLQPESATAAR